MRRVAFLPHGFEDFVFWAEEDRRIYAKIVILIRDILRDPFTGLGKPEPLKHQLKGLWSRRITDEHRLIYQVTDEEIIIIGCRFHYS